MDSNYVSLRQFIDDVSMHDNLKIHTFCRLMDKVSRAMEEYDKPIIRINLDDIYINSSDGDIKFTDDTVNGDTLGKTMVDINTGISLMADRKSTAEHKRVAFALMLLGWYVNDDGSAVLNDLAVLENFDIYMKEVPEFLKNYFEMVFKNMDYGMSFSEYYKKHFIDKVQGIMYKEYKDLNLSSEEYKKLAGTTLRVASKICKGDVSNG